MTEPLLTTSEVARILQIAPITVRKWRLNGLGPRFTRCGANVRYSRADLDVWILSRTVASTSEAQDSSGPNENATPIKTLACKP